VDRLAFVPLAFVFVGGRRFVAGGLLRRRRGLV
jgi:hypothetical protein